MNRQGNVLGTYLHGLFDGGQLLRAITAHLLGGRAEDTPCLTMEQFREQEFDRIAQVVRDSVDMRAVYAILRGEI